MFHFLYNVHDNKKRVITVIHANSNDNRNPRIRWLNVFDSINRFEQNRIGRMYTC